MAFLQWCKEVASASNPNPRRARDRCTPDHCFVVPPVLESHPTPLPGLRAAAVAFKAVTLVMRTATGLVWVCHLVLRVTSPPRKKNIQIIPPYSSPPPSGSCKEGGDGNLSGGPVCSKMSPPEVARTPGRPKLSSYSLQRGFEGSLKSHLDACLLTYEVAGRQHDLVLHSHA